MACKETAEEIRREETFREMVLLPRKQWLDELGEPMTSIVIGNLRAAFNAGWFAVDEMLSNSDRSA
jgi:hypothetical protein